jgi:hypothetical protein
VLLKVHPSLAAWSQLASLLALTFVFKHAAPVLAVLHRAVLLFLVTKLNFRLEKRGLI